MKQEVVLRILAEIGVTVVKIWRKEVIGTYL
jgi:hypothetical protein